MSLLESPLSSAHLRKTPKRFETVLGLKVEVFDTLFEKVYAAELSDRKRRHVLMTKQRIEALTLRFRPVLKEHLCLTLVYLRQYPVQEVLAAGFSISQAQVSRIIERMSLLLSQVLPTPELTAKAILTFVESLPAELLEAHAAPVVLDASEQRIERNRENAQQQKDYSGKKSATAESFNSLPRRTS